MFLIKGMLCLKEWVAKGGGNFLIKGMFLTKRLLYLKAWAAKGRKFFDQRNVFEKKNVVLAPESLKARVAQRAGKIFIKVMLYCT